MARNREFEINEVLDRAMILFWEQGYEKTSMTDLVEHMGIHRRSLYDTFGDKRSLFLRAMDRYLNQVTGTLTGGIKMSKTATEALQVIFRFMIFDEEGSPSGCLMINSVTELAARDADVDAKAIKAFNETEHMFEQIILWGQQDGEFISDYTAKEMAEYLHMISVGIRAMGRTTVDKEKINRIANVSLELLKK